ncbi:class I SAM-dependent methyltransferase [Sphaerisporangium album]|nr:class I SAM-dependent methyltransferase [Sphaerisporangium album]
MAVRNIERGAATRGGAGVGLGMEQFHHPRPVGRRGDGSVRPTPQRAQLMTGLAGRVLEIGAGDGVKITCYPDTVDEIILVDTDPFLRAAAEAVAARAPVAVRVLDGVPERLPMADSSCDAVVCSLVLCQVPSPAATLAEIRRILRPGGSLRFCEHQRSASPLVAAAEQVVTPLWSRLSGGCHLARDVIASIERAGFAIGDIRHFGFRRFGHVLGTARPHP